MNSNKLSFKETKELKDLNIKLPLLEQNKLSIERQINEVDSDIVQNSKRLAEIIEIIKSYEERWLELSEIEQLD